MNEKPNCDISIQLNTLLLFCSHAVMFNSLCAHGLQHARLSCPSPSPRACSNSCLLSQWCHPTISSYVTPFYSCPQSFLTSGSFPMHSLFTSGSKSIRGSALASVLPMNIQGWFPLGWTGWISLVRSPVLITRHTQQTRVPQAKSVRWSHSLPNLRNAQALAGREGGGWSWGPPGVGTGTGVLSHRGRWPRAGV